MGRVPSVEAGMGQVLQTRHARGIAFGDKVLNGSMNSH